MKRDAILVDLDRVARDPTAVDAWSADAADDSGATAAKRGYLVRAAATDEPRQRG
jgi:hypothetical protein